ncbi:hypothetical protein J7E49_20695 [Variovorax paradoxus]|nr:hypothetical protein [Variovorax paradoxus]
MTLKSFGSFSVTVPARRGGRQQHGPGARAELAVLREAVLDRVGAAGKVHAEGRVVVGAASLVPLLLAGCDFAVGGNPNHLSK